VILELFDLLAFRFLLYLLNDLSTANFGSSLRGNSQNAILRDVKLSSQWWAASREAAGKA
jgi:hypothetical protein